MKKIILTAMVVITSISLKAQQDAMISQYMFNGVFLNPAYSGTHQYFSSTAMHRSQWIKFEGAPVTGSLAIDGPIHNNKMGIGFLLVHDQIGVSTQTDLFANYSYKIKAGNGKLAFGAKAGASQYCAKLTSLTVWDENDEIFGADKSSCWIPKFGFGTYYYTNRMYVGFSIPTLIAYDQTKEFSFDVERSSNIRKHYYLNGGYVMDMGSSVKFKPSILVKYVPSAPVEADLNAHFLFNNVLWIGATYRTGDAVIGLIEYQINKNLRVGYAYDYAVSIMNQYSRGTHEIMIGYDFLPDKIKVKTPRFF